MKKFEIIAPAYFFSSGRTPLYLMVNNAGITIEKYFSHILKKHLPIFRKQENSYMGKPWDENRVNDLLKEGFKSATTVNGDAAAEILKHGNKIPKIKITIEFL